MKQKPIRQQVVVVVGASSGIGRATALRFAEEGARVVVAARDEAALEALVREIRAKKGTAVAMKADVAHADQMKRVADRAIAEFGRIDTWAHVAGVGYFSPFQLARPDEMARVVEVNLLGQMYGARAALSHMLAQGSGTLVHVSSVEAAMAIPLSGIYSASKSGMRSFLDALRLELERQGAPIAVVEVRPSSIDTPLFREAMTRLGVEPRPIAPVYAPEIVARAIVRAAERPEPRIVVGGAGAAAEMLGRLSPRLLERLLMTRIGFESQLSRTPKAPDAPNNLFAPMPGRSARVHGEHGAGERHTSLYTALATSAPAHLARAATAPLLEMGARMIEAMWALRNARSMKRRAAGLPAPVAREIAREEKAPQRRARAKR